VALKSAKEQNPHQAEAMTTLSEAALHILATRTRVGRRGHVREIVFGAQDGLLTSLGLVAGVSGATTGRISVLVAGFAGGLAGMLAMGAGAYVSGKAQTDVQEEDLRLERSEIESNLGRETNELVELFIADGLESAEAQAVADAIARHPDAMLAEMAEKEMGIAAAGGRPLLDGVVMGFTFLLGAVIPIVPWIVAPVTSLVVVGPFTPSPALVLSVVATAAALFLIGIGKGRLSGGNQLRSGLEIAIIGLGCAVVAFLLGTVVPDLLGLHPLSAG
jgi:VIT1/CCC1 family predicted Fe2+/Mn2+ transporter